MTLAIRAIEVHATVAKLQASAGPAIPHYALTLDTGRVYQFVVGNVETDDGARVLAPTGGTVGRWKLVQASVGLDQGADLTDADATLTVAQGLYRVAQLSTFTAERTFTLSTVGAFAGQIMSITKLDLEAFSQHFVNGGPGGGTLLSTSAFGNQTFIDLRFNGVDWVHMRSGALI